MSVFEAPSPEQVQAALRRLTTYQLRRAFYEGLKNPSWVAPLAAAGAFADPPEPEPTADGYIRELFWPEVSYLVAVAEQAPSDVVDVLLALESSTNSWVRRAAFSVGARISSQQASRLKPLVDAWGTDFGWRTDPRDLVSFVVNLLNGGDTRFGVSLANLLFRPHASDALGREPAAGIREHRYSDELPRVVDALGGVALKTVLPWLIEYEGLRNGTGSDFDNTGFERSLIANRSKSYHPIQDALIDAVRDAAIERLTNDPADAWRLLNRHPILIVRRIALYTVATVLASSSSPRTGEVLPIARELLVDVKCRDSSALVEFVELARTVASTAPAQLDVLRQVVNEGQFSRTDVERMTRNMRARDLDSAEIEADIRRWSENWCHRLLAGIGREPLPPDLQQKLDRLDEAHGAMSGPIPTPFEVTTWSGPNSPISLEEMSAMSPSELVAHLESWHDDSVGIGPEPSHEGQARVLSDLLKSQPLALGDAPNLVHRLRPTYLRAIFSGWEAADRADLDLDWSTVVAMITDVLAHDDVSPYPVEGGRFDDDPDFQGAKHAAIGLIEELAKPKTVRAAPFDTLVQLAELLIRCTEGDEHAWHEYSDYQSGSESGMDPLTTSLNWQWPKLVRGLINLIAHGEDAPWYDRALEALDQELARPDERGASRAALGEGLGKLFNQAPAWLAQRRDQIFGTQAGATRNQQIALTTAIAVHYYHPALYALLGGPMIAALNEGADIAVGWGQQTSPVERVGQWIVEAVVRGDIQSEDPVRSAFYTVAPPDARGDAIGHIAWSFMHADAVDDEIRDRLADLWDERIAHVRDHPEDRAELKGFYWFVRSEKYPPSWWLPRLNHVLELDNEFNTHGMIGEALAIAAHEFPRQSLDALTLLLKSDDTPDRDGYDLRMHALAPVIAASLDSQDDQLVADATAFMNRMGERGEIDLERRVQALRNDS